MATKKRTLEGIKAEIEVINNYLKTNNVEYINIDTFNLTDKQSSDYKKKLLIATANMKLSYLQEHEELYNYIKQEAPHIIQALINKAIPVFMYKALINNYTLKQIQNKADNRLLIHYLFQVLMGEIEEFITPVKFSNDDYNIIKNPKASIYSNITEDADLIAVNKAGDIVDYIEVQSLRQDRWDSAEVYIKTHKLLKARGSNNNYKLYLYVWDKLNGTYKYIILKKEDLKDIDYIPDCIGYGGKSTYKLNIDNTYILKELY